MTTAEMTLMERTWTQVGHDHNSTNEQKKKLGKMFDRLKWQKIGSDGITMAMMPGEAIKAAVKELSTPPLIATAIDFGDISIRYIF